MAEFSGRDCLSTDKVEQLVNETNHWNAKSEKIIEEPYEYLAIQPGKNIRSKLIKTFNLIYKLSDEQVDLVDKLIKILHTSSLLIDDIEDSSVSRRGIPTAHLKYGVPMTINSANYMYFKAMEILQRLNIVSETSALHEPNPQHSYELFKIFNEELLNLHRGQALDIYWRDSFPEFVPNENMYYEMVMNKTGGLFRLAIRLMELLSTEYSGKKSLVPMINLVGILYQVRDDYQNLTDEKMIKNKGFAEDISEGKLSFPIIHGINFEKQNGGSTFLSEVLQAKTSDVKEKRKAVSFLSETSKSLQYCTDTTSALTTLLKNKYLTQIDNDDARLQFSQFLDFLFAN